MARTNQARSDLLTVEQVADYLQLNKLTIYKYIREGRLPAVKIGKVYRVRRPDIEAFLESKRIRPPAASAAKPTKPVQRVVTRPEEIAVAPPPRRGAKPDVREETINPMEWMSRGLH
jgi:excisionase family DNA binding protein